MKARILSIPSDRMPLYAPWIGEVLAETYAEDLTRPPTAATLERELAACAREREAILLVSEVVEPASPGSATAPPGYAEAALLLATPIADPLFRAVESWLRALYTKPLYRRRGIAAALLTRAEALLAERGVAALRAEVFYSDDPVVSLFERREYERGRMALRKRFAS